MIQFGCPNCNMLLNAPHGKTGTVNPCPGCGEMVQVPKPDAAGKPRRRSLREGWGAFWALCRFFLWGICMAAIVFAVFAFYEQIPRATTEEQKTAVSTQALVWILGAYFIARAFELSSKSLEEMFSRVRRRS